MELEGVRRMNIKYLEVPCSYCGETVERLRIPKGRNVRCYGCKIKQNMAREYEKREERKKQRGRA